MPWLTDEEYFLREDTREKSVTARSSHSTRTHCGKGGSVKFPSDFMSKKELASMNGECKSYRLGSPMDWNEFKSMPEEHQITYIKLLRAKYKIPDSKLAEAMGVSQQTFSPRIRDLGLSLGKAAGAAGRRWVGSSDQDNFLTWWNGVKKDDDCSESPVETVEPANAEVEEAVDNFFNNEAVKQGYLAHEETCEDHAVDVKKEDTPCEAHQAGDPKIVEDNVRKRVVPSYGDMSFDGPIEEVLGVIQQLLDGRYVRLNVNWSVYEE